MRLSGARPWQALAPACCAGFLARSADTTARGFWIWFAIGNLHLVAAAWVL